MNRSDTTRRHRKASLYSVLALGLLLSGCTAPPPPERSLEVASQGLYSAALSGDGQLAVVGSIAQGGSLWRLGTDERLFDWNHRADALSEITAAAFSPDGRFAATVEVRDLVLWDTESGAALSWFAAPAEILDIALSPDARYAVLGLVDHTAVLFDVRRGGGNLRVFQHDDRVRSVSLSDDGQRLMTGSEDRTARLWNVETGEQLFRWDHREPVRLVALAPDGSRGFSVSKYDRAVVWDATTGSEIGALPLHGTAIARGMTFTAARFSADSNQLLTGSSDREVQLWDSYGLRKLASWELPKRQAWKPTGASVMALAFDADMGNRYWVAASNGFVHRLNAP